MKDYFQVHSVVIELNLDTVRNLVSEGRIAIYGDATRRDVLEAAGVRQANYLLITNPDIFSRTVVIVTAREFNPGLRVFVRARYIGERAWLEEIGAMGIATEEAETAIGLAILLLREVGADEERIRKEIQEIRRELAQIGSAKKI